MNNILIRSIRLVSAIALAAVLLVGGAVAAQRLIPSTEPGGQEFREFQIMPPSYDSAAPELSSDLPPDENPLTGAGASAPLAPSLVFSYYMVSGTAMLPRNSSSGYGVSSHGCAYTLGAWSDPLVSELHLPQGSVIKYLRVYYEDTNSASGVRGYLARYTPGLATTDMANVGSSAVFNSGYGFVVSQELTETVNNSTYAYLLFGWPDEVGGLNKICGLRVAYYAPPGFASFMPVVR